MNNVTFQWRKLMGHHVSTQKMHFLFKCSPRKLQPIRCFSFNFCFNQHCPKYRFVDPIKFGVNYQQDFQFEKKYAQSVAGIPIVLLCIRVFLSLRFTPSANLSGRAAYFLIKQSQIISVLLL